MVVMGLKSTEIQHDYSRVWSPKVPKIEPCSPEILNHRRLRHHVTLLKTSSLSVSLFTAFIWQQVKFTVSCGKVSHQSKL